MTRRSSFRTRLVAGEPMTGAFLKVPTHQHVELLASGVDVVAIDTEHAPIGPVELDAMLAVAVALDVACLVRVSGAEPALVQQALDGGATGVVVPHVDSPARAADVARWSRYGPGGRGYSGSTRSAGWGRRPMADVLATAAVETTVIVQVEDAAALETIEDLVAVDGVDGVFVGVADLAVALGADEPDSPEVQTAVDAVIAAARSAGRPLATYAATSTGADDWRRRGVTLVFVGSDQSRLLGSP